jgi:uncharacterized protein (UPF0332 family)
MMTDEKKKLLASHRLQQAKESVEEARYLLDGGKSTRSVANRIYYGMFYAVLALLIYECPLRRERESNSYFREVFLDFCEK